MKDSSDRKSRPVLEAPTFDTQVCGVRPSISTRKDHDGTFARLTGHCYNRAPAGRDNAARSRSRPVVVVDPQRVARDVDPASVYMLTVL